MRHENSAELALPQTQLEASCPTDRFKMGRPARVVVANLQDSCEVTIVDLSSGGVKLVCDPSVSIPLKFYLLTTGRDIGHVRYACDMRWRVGGTFGARFEQPLADCVVDAILNPSTN